MMITKDEPVYGVWDRLLNPKSFLPSAAERDGRTHASRAFNSMSMALNQVKNFSEVPIVIITISTYN